MIDHVLADRIVNLLNEALALDPVAVHYLCDERVSCNMALANHPTIQVQDTPTSPRVGVLGLLNGLCGVDDRGWGDIAAEYSNGRIQQFVRLSRPATDAHKVSIGNVKVTGTTFNDPNVKASPLNGVTHV